MARCTFCDHRNPASLTRCEQCGAELPGAPIQRSASPERQRLTGLDAEIADLVEREGKIAAIKRYREATGLGLKESKDAVEQLMSETGIQPAGGGGCAAGAAAILAAMSLVVSALLAGGARWPW